MPANKIILGLFFIIVLLIGVIFGMYLSGRDRAGEQERLTEKKVPYLLKMELPILILNHPRLLPQKEIRNNSVNKSIGYPMTILRLANTAMPLG